MADVFVAKDKQPGEIKTWAIEYASKLATGETLSSIEAATAIREDTGADVTAAFIASSQISGTQVKVKVQNGTSDVRYKVSTRVVTSVGHKFDADIKVLVKEY